VAPMEAGQSLHEIGRAFGKEHSSIRCLVARHGGIVPAVRRRSGRVLTAVERRGHLARVASGASLRKIAQLLDRRASTVSRGSGPAWRRPEVSRHERISEPGTRPCAETLACFDGGSSSRVVASKRLLDWSPEQIPDG